ncbi:MAG: AzlD domain-containing protein [Anaeromyxobacteraceae bacterium]
MSFWLVMLAGGAVTFATRLSFIAAEGRVSLPRWFRATLPFVPIATLTAIIAPEVVMPGGTLALSLSNPRLVAGCAAVVVAAVTRNVLVTIAVGFAVLFLVR